MSSELVKEIRESDNYTTFKRVVANVKKRVDLESSTKEALTLHASRLSRNIHGEHRYRPKTIIDADLQDMSVRGRLVEIRVRNDLQLSTMRDAIEAMRRHIITEYADDLREFGTVSQRASFVNRVLKSHNTFLADGEALVALLDALIKDVDQAGYRTKGIIECLKLLEGSKSGRVV